MSTYYSVTNKTKWLLIDFNERNQKIPMVHDNALRWFLKDKHLNFPYKLLVYYKEEVKHAFEIIKVKLHYGGKTKT